MTVVDLLGSNADEKEEEIEQVLELEAAIANFR